MMNRMCTSCCVFLLIYISRNVQGQNKVYVNRNATATRLVELTCSQGQVIRVQTVEIRLCYGSSAYPVCTTEPWTNSSLPSMCDGQPYCYTSEYLPPDTREITVNYECIWSAASFSTTIEPTTTFPTTVSPFSTTDTSLPSSPSAINIGLGCGAAVFAIILIVAVVLITKRCIRRRNENKSLGTVDKTPTPIKPQNISRPPLPPPRPTSETPIVGGDYLELVSSDNSYSKLEHDNQQPEYTDLYLYESMVDNARKKDKV